MLKKFPNHGETLAMKGLTLNSLEKKEEVGGVVGRLDLHMFILTRVGAKGRWHRAHLLTHTRGHCVCMRGLWSNVRHLSPRPIHVQPHVA